MQKRNLRFECTGKKVRHNLKRPITFSLLDIYFVFAWSVEGPVSYTGMSSAEN